MMRWLRTHRRRAGIRISAYAVLGFALCGCQAGSARQALQWHRSASGPAYAKTAPVRSILSARGGYGAQVIDPQSFAFRSTWPSTEGPYQVYQTVYFHERWYNYQSLFSTPDQTFKRFESHRSGVEFR